MRSIETVTGPIDSPEVGFTLVHEHLLVRADDVQSQFPRAYENPGALSVAIEAFQRLKDIGVDTVCDPTVMGLGRDVRLMIAVAEATGMNIIAATGVYTLSRLPPLLAHRSEDYLADLFVEDIEHGIQGTDARAGFIKCATDARGVTADVEKVLRACARAHLRTDVPIMTHSLASNGSGLLQQDVFEDEGVDLQRVMVGHCGDTTDIDYLTQILARGSYIGMDRYGLDELLDTPSRNQTVMKLWELGFANRMFLSQDAVCLSDWIYTEELKASRTDWSLFFVCESVIPELRALGLPQIAIDVMMRANVLEWFGAVG